VTPDDAADELVDDVEDESAEDGVLGEIVDDDGPLEDVDAGEDVSFVLPGDR